MRDISLTREKQRLLRIYLFKKQEIKTADTHTTTTPARTQQQADSQPFFQPEREQGFFGGQAVSEPFFNSPATSSGISNSVIQRQCDSCEEQGQLQTKTDSPQFTSGTSISPASNIPIIQREESPRDELSVTKSNLPGQSRIGSCPVNPQFPDFRCYVTALKLDIDENLKNNAYQFFRVAALHPEDSTLMTQTFMRYGLGVNVLQSTFGFMGFRGNWRDAILPYGTGAAIKTTTFIKDGLLELDIPIDIGDNYQLDLQFDMHADPTNNYQIQSVQGIIGFSKKL